MRGNRKGHVPFGLELGLNLLGVVVRLLHRLEGLPCAFSVMMRFDLIRASALSYYRPVYFPDFLVSWQVFTFRESALNFLLR